MSASKKIKDCSDCQKFLEKELSKCEDWEINRKRIIEEVKNSAWDCPNYGSRHSIVDYKGTHHYQYCQNKDCYKCWTQCTECGKEFKDKRGKCTFCSNSNNVCVIPTSDGIISVSCDKCHTLVTSNNGFGDSNVNNHGCEQKQLQTNQASHQTQSTQSKLTSNSSQSSVEREREREQCC